MTKTHRHAASSDSVAAATCYPPLDNLAASDLIPDPQTAFYLNVKPTTLPVWRSTGRYDLPFVKIGRLVRYRAGDVREFIRKRTRNSGATA